VGPKHSILLPNLIAEIGVCIPVRQNGYSRFFLRISVEDLTPFISDELRQATMPVVFRTSRGRAIYDARLISMVCEVYLMARDAHLKA
jgi:hypothetical protein